MQVPSVYLCGILPSRIPIEERSFHPKPTTPVPKMVKMCTLFGKTCICAILVSTLGQSGIPIGKRAFHPNHNQNPTNHAYPNAYPNGQNHVNQIGQYMYLYPTVLNLKASRMAIGRGHSTKTKPKAHNSCVP